MDVSGDLAIGGNVDMTNPGAKLEIAGQLKITGGSPGADKILTSDATGLVSWQTSASGLPSGTSGQTLRHDGTDWVVNDLIYNDGADFNICKNGTCCPIWKDCDGDGKTFGNGDCDESCDTCFVGSDAMTASPDGLDQDCDGTVDEDGGETITVILNCATGQTCNDMCSSGGYGSCVSAGTDGGGTNGNDWWYWDDYGGCHHGGWGACGNPMYNQSYGSCGGHTVRWTNCRCALSGYQ